MGDRYRKALAAKETGKKKRRNDSGLYIPTILYVHTTRRVSIINLARANALRGVKNRIPNDHEKCIGTATTRPRRIYV